MEEFINEHKVRQVHTGVFPLSLKSCESSEEADSEGSEFYLCLLWNQAEVLETKNATLQNISLDVRGL